VDVALEDVVLRAVGEAVQAVVIRGVIIAFEHVVALRLKPVERLLRAVRAVPRARSQAFVRFGAATSTS
jgi:hypothetical protein